MNSNDKNQSFKKLTKSNRKENKLFVEYELQDADIQSTLYKDYIKIANKKRSQEKRRTYLIEQEKKYKTNNMEFPEWAKKEREFFKEKSREAQQKVRRTDKWKRRKEAEQQAISVLRKKRREGRPLNKKELEKLQKLDMANKRGHKNHYDKSKKLTNDVAANKLEGLTNKDLQMVLTKISAYLRKTNKQKCDSRCCYNLKLDNELKQIARDNDINQFKEYLKKRKDQGVEIANLFDDFENINNQPFNSFMPLDENEEDQKEANFKFHIPENNSPENGEQQKIEDGIDKTINYWGLTTFKPMENQQENGYFSLNNTDNILGNNDSQGF